MSIKSHFAKQNVYAECSQNEKMEHFAEYIFYQFNFWLDLCWLLLEISFLNSYERDGSRNDISMLK